MTAPPAPSLPPLHDILQPEGVPVWPPGPGVWIALALLVVTAGTVLYGIWQRGRLRRGALRELTALRQRCGDGEADRFALGVSTLLRRVALSRFPRQQVASLFGGAWLQFLDRSGHTDAFTHGPGRFLGWRLWSGRGAVDVDALERVARAWITTVCR